MHPEILPQQAVLAHVSYMLLQLAGHAEKLKVALLEDGHRPIESPFFAASYDPPTRFTGRHNEIMMSQERIGWL